MWSPLNYLEVDFIVGILHIHMYVTPKVEVMEVSLNLVVDT